MSDNMQYTLINGIKCFSPKMASAYTDYPDAGFDLTDECGENSFWVRSRNRLFKKIVHDQLNLSGKTKFLEIGCGTGCFIQKIVKNKKLEIKGSEIYLKGLLYAQKKLPNVEFIQFDVTQGTIDEAFDLIVAFDVLEHIEKDIIAISNIKKMLNKGGRLIVSVPQHKFLWSKLDEIVKHKRRYSRQELLGKLIKNGFDICYSTSFLCILFPLMLVSRLRDKGPDRDTRPDGAALEKRVKFPNMLNQIFDFFMRIDEALIRMGVRLPFGGTLLVIAKKR